MFKFNSYTGFFIAFTFLISWGIVGIFFLAGGTWNSNAAQFIATGYMFIPLLVSVAITKFIKKEPVGNTLGISFKFNYLNLLFSRWKYVISKF